jgi:hypothetical protein
MIELPRLYPAQSKSGRKIQIPNRIWNSVFFCIEYPNGILIDKTGVPRPEMKVHAPDDFQVGLYKDDELCELSKPERREQRNLRVDIKCQNDYTDYYKDDEYSPDVDIQSVSSENDVSHDESYISEDDDDTDNETDPPSEDDGFTDEGDSDNVTSDSEPQVDPTSHDIDDVVPCSMAENITVDDSSQCFGDEPSPKRHKRDTGE